MLFMHIFLILCGDIETNPGPYKNDHDNVKDSIPFINKDDFTIATYNVQGLLDYKKHKRINNFIHKLPFKKNMVLCLQETHFKEVNRLKYLWNSGIHEAHAVNGSGGVAILYSSEYFDDVIETGKDSEEGRWCYIICTKNDTINMYLNIYAPTQKVNSIPFFDKINSLLNDKIIQEPSLMIHIAGDFNIVLDPNVDSINRTQSSQEIQAVNTLHNIMQKYSLADSYRTQNEWGGFTWGRNNPNIQRSRLDYILTPIINVPHITTSYVTKYPQ